jgi:hypothetical protein
MEVLCIADTDEERHAAGALFASMKRIYLTLKITQKAVEESQARGLKLPDAVILASTDCGGCILVTRNTKDFAKDDLRVRFPYSL